MLEEQENNKKLVIKSQAQLEVEIENKYSKIHEGLNDQINALKLENNRSKKDFENRESSMEKQIADINQQLEEKKSFLTEIGNEMTNIKEKNKEYKKTLNEKIEENMQMQDEMEKNRKDNDILSKDNQGLSIRISILEEESNRVKKELEDREILNEKQIANINKQLEEKVSFLDSTMNEMTMEKEKSRDVEKALKLKEDENVQIQEEMKQNVKENDMLKKDNERISTQVSTLEEENVQLKKELEENELAKKEEIMNLRKEMEEKAAIALEAAVADAVEKNTVINEYESKSTQTDPIVTSDGNQNGDVQKELNDLHTFTKKVLQNVQQLEKDKSSYKERIAVLEKQIAEMESNIDDQSSIGSNTINNYLKGEMLDDDYSTASFNNDDMSISSKPRTLVGGLFRKNGQILDNSEIVSIPQGEILYKEEKIKELQVAKVRHEKTIGSLVQEVMKLRKAQKDASLQFESLQHEREAFKMKIAVLEKEFSLLEVNSMAETQNEISNKFKNVSRQGSSGFVAETATQLELRVKDQKISYLEKLINEDKQLIASMRSEIGSHNTVSQKVAKSHEEQLEKVRRENISLFQKVKQLEKEISEVRNQGVRIVDDENEDTKKASEDLEIDYSSLSKQNKDYVMKINRTVKDHERKIEALKRCNEMIEKNSSQLRREYVNLRSNMRAEIKKHKVDIEKLKQERDKKASRIIELEKELESFNTIQEEKKEDNDNAKEKRGFGILRKPVENKETITMLNLKLTNLKDSKEREVNELSIETAKLTEEKNQLEKDIHKYLAQIDEDELEIKSKSTELEFIKEQLNCLEEERMLMEEDFQAKLTARDEAIHHLDGTVFKLREKNFELHEVVTKKKKKKKKKKHKAMSNKAMSRKLIKEASSRNMDVDALATILEKMMVDEDDDHIHGNLQSDSETGSHFETETESEYETESEFESDGQNLSNIKGRRNPTGYGKLLPGSKDDIDDIESDFLLTSDASDVEYMRPKTKIKKLLSDSGSEHMHTDEDDIFEGLPIQPHNVSFRNL